MDLNIRNLLWRRYFPKQSDAKCPICGTRDISFDDFDAAHIVPDGKDDIDNLVPTCRKCNDACKRKNLLMYKYENFPNIHTTTNWIPSVKSLIDEIDNLRNRLKLCEDKTIEIPQKSGLVSEKPEDKNEIDQVEIWSGIWEDVLGKKRDRSYCNFKRYKNSFHQNVGIWGNIYTSKQQISLELYLQKDKDTFDKITKDIKYIEETIKDSTESVEFKCGKAKSNYHVYLKKNVDLNDKIKWKEYANWILNKSKKFEEVFDKYFVE